MRKGILAVLLICLVIVAFVSPFASPHPDGLERVAEDKGFIHLSEGKAMVKALMPDYVIPGMKNKTVAGSLAGIAGTLVTFGAMYGIGKLYLKRSRRAGDQK